MFRLATLLVLILLGLTLLDVLLPHVETFLAELDVKELGRGEKRSTLGDLPEPFGRYMIKGRSLA